MNEGIIFPSTGLNIIFGIVLCVFVLLLFVRRYDFSGSEKNLIPSNIQCVLSIGLLLVNFLWILYLVHSHSSVENVGWNTVACAVIALIAGAITVACMFESEDAVLMINAGNLAISVIGLFFLLSLYFLGIIYCVAAIVISLVFICCLERE